MKNSAFKVHRRHLAFIDAKDFIQKDLITLNCIVLDCLISKIAVWAAVVSFMKNASEIWVEIRIL